MHFIHDCGQAEKFQFSQSARSRMVVVPSSISESCEKIEETLNKLQPKLGLSLMTSDLTSFLSKNFVSEEKSIKLAVKKAMKGKDRCQGCSDANASELQAHVFHQFDWDELTYSPKEIRVLCPKCATLCSWSKLASAQLSESVLESSDVSLSELIELYLKVNGYSLSEIAKFNAAMSLFASLRISADQLNLSLELPDSKSVSDLVASLVSSK